MKKTDWKMVKNVLVIAILLFFQAHGWPQETAKTPPAQIREQSGGTGLKVQQPHAERDIPVLESPSPVAKSSFETAAAGGQAPAETTEFWPPICGYRLKITDTLLVGVTFLLFLATGALWVATAHLVEGAEDTAERQLRAYVSANPQTVHGFGSSQRISVDFSLQNHGQTPAFEIDHVFGMGVFANPLPEDFKFPPANRDVFNKSALFPRADMISWFNNDRILSSDEVRDIENDTDRFYIWGKITYRDAFGKLRHTNFSASAGGAQFAKSVRATQSGAKDPGFRWQFGSKHNHAS